MEKFVCIRKIEPIENAKWWIKNLKKNSMLIKFGIWGFLMSLIMNTTTSARNSKRLIEYGGQKSKNYPTLMQISMLRFLELLITNLFLYSWNLKWRIQYAERKIKIVHYWSKLVDRDSALLAMIYENLTTKQESVTTKALANRVSPNQIII